MTAPRITATKDGVRVDADAYTWRWSRATDQAVLAHPSGATVLSYPLQPCIEIAGREGSSGTCAAAKIDGASLRVAYERANGDAALRITLRFEATHFVIEDTTYDAPDEYAVVRLSHFAAWRDGRARPAARAPYVVIPGGRQDPEQAIFATADLDGVRFSIGAFGMGTGTYHQQWALPHYLVACFSGGATGAACAGLGRAPDGNVMSTVDCGAFSYEINVRGDLWGHRTGPGIMRFDDPIVVAVANGWYEAGLAYFAALDAEGYAPQRETPLPASASCAQYDTWGDQGARRCFLERFDERHLREIYADFVASGLAARLFVIDDKWEGVYGSLAHDERRFPRFRELLDEIRGGGHEVGLWTAFPRCEDYRGLGLDERSVLVTPGGEPYVVRERKREWCVFDPTDERAAAYLRERARYLVETYRPALVKIDFGYEIPTPDVAGPHDSSLGGERLFERFLEVICGEIRRADPRVAILYYCLTPLFRRYIDQCGMDDLWMSRGAYDDGHARRALLSSWCGAFGVVPYGSSGYDWRSAEEIWLDSALIGAPGLIAPLAGDEYGERLTPALAARYNGVARIARRGQPYRAVFSDAELRDPADGPRARTWAREEDGAITVVALRPDASGIARASDVATATCRAAIASLGDADVRSADRIAIVPFGEGIVTLTRGDARVPRATAHLFGGATVAVPVRSIPERIEIEVATEHAGAPIEYVDITFEP